MYPETDDPQELLADVASLRGRTQDLLNADGWQWMLVWGIVAFGAAFSVFLEALNVVAGFYWFAAVPAALMATSALERRSKTLRPVRRDQRPYWAIGALIGVVNFGGSLVVEAEVFVIMIWVVIGLGFAGFAIIDRDIPTATLFVAAALIAVVLGAAIDDAAVAYGAISLLFAGLLSGSAMQTYTRYRHL